MNVIILNSPLVQLNAPYPSGAYLFDFFKSEGAACRWFDLSNQLFYSIFSKEGLTKLFALSEKSALKMADAAESSGDEVTAFNLRRYISCSEQWIEWIDFIVGMLCSGRKDFSERELCHKFLFSPFALRGNRMEVFLSGIAESGRDATIDDVRFLSSYALADLADYITAVFDPDFSLIRYAEALTVDESSFEEIEKRLDSPILKEFFLPLLEKLFDKNGPLSDFIKSFSVSEKTLVCISAPFAGTFVPSLYTARFLKEKFADKVYISMGGGFVNTELRAAKDTGLGNYVNILSFDRGYGSYKNIFDEGLLSAGKNTSTPIYKARQFIKDGEGEISVIDALWQSQKYETYEGQKTFSVRPDYSDIDFSLYPRLCDDLNAMHRMWNDGAWIKAYLAHGCYWHKCAFCDVHLDYVCAYRPVDIEKLYERLLETAKEKGVYGIHLVDEALPSRIVKDFALCNARHGSPLYFWGNVRFEKTFTKDLAAFLSYCGFGGVSAGIESATGKGLENINKGTDIQSIVNACAAFKEAGILVHAYMIYGFWNDRAQEIVDSMETLRQFFENGLLDSAFWHKFVLTRNSRVFGEWEKGLHKELNPILPKKSASIFAGNNLHFVGEKSFEKFGPPLENALNSWMHGQKLGMKVQKWFDFPIPSPSVKADFIENCIEKYEKENSLRSQKIDLEKSAAKLYWLGSKPIIASNKIVWNYLQEEEMLAASQIKACGFSSRDFASLLWDLRPSASVQVREELCKQLANFSSSKKGLESLIRKLHYRGIVEL
ncbi:MAG: radical SAM protein [Treponema sp.]|nr:radical SAM protein [Treponema sp.]